MLKIIEFIRENSNWQELLTVPPYSLKIKRDGDYVLLSYSQFHSNLNIELVRECRGLILDASDNYAPVCVPFFKFGNYGEGYAAEIDWNTAVVWDKIDGSLIKLWFHRGKWNVSTNGTIDASKATVMSESGTYLDLFLEAEKNSGLDRKFLNPENTYMFELISPKSTIVVPYKETTLYHIATRNIKTLKELDEDIGIQKPERYSLRTLDDCLNSAKLLDACKEGYVVSDANYQRIKIKSPLYVSLHHLVGGVALTERKALELIQSGEDKEVLAYFGEHAEFFDQVRKKINRLVEAIEQELADVQADNFETRKELAATVTKKTCPGCLFMMIDGKVGSVREYMMGLTTDKLERYLNMEGVTNKKKNPRILREADPSKSHMLGRLNGKVKIPDDFDEPLEEMKEYMF